METRQMDHQNTARYIADAAAATTVIGTLIGWLPSVAALFSIIWLGIQISDRSTRDDSVGTILRIFTRRSKQ